MAELKLKDLLGAAYKEGMTYEEVEQAIIPLVSNLQTENDRIGAENKRLNDLNEKANSDVAKYKHQYNNSLDDAQKAEQKRQEEWDALVEENKSLKRNSSIAEYTANFVKQGYDEKLARDTAEALVDGNNEKVFANQEKFITGLKKGIEADEMRRTPTQPTGEATNEKAITKEDFAKMSFIDRQNLFEKNPQLYEELKK